MIFLRVIYYLIVIASATAGIFNTLQLRSQRQLIDGQHRRLSLIENVRDRFRDRVMRSDQPADHSEPAPQIIYSHLLDRIEALEHELREKGK